MKHYTRLIERAKHRNLACYTEKHHIVPRCLGGTDEPSNLVSLTAAEHYIAHQLLIKIYPDSLGLACAAMMMTFFSETTVGRSRNKLYEWIRRRHARLMSISQTGSGNSQYGTCWVSNFNTFECKKIKLSEIELYQAAGWVRKRVINWDKIKSRVNCVICGTLHNSSLKTCSVKCGFERLKRIKSETNEDVPPELYVLYERYKSGETLQEVSKDFEYSYVTLYKRFRKYFPDIDRKMGRKRKGPKL